MVCRVLDVLCVLWFCGVCTACTACVCVLVFAQRSLRSPVDHKKKIMFNSRFHNKYRHFPSFQHELIIFPRFSPLLSSYVFRCFVIYMLKKYETSFGQKTLRLKLALVFPVRGSGFCTTKKRDTAMCPSTSSPFLKQTVYGLVVFR